MLRKNFLTKNYRGNVSVGGQVVNQTYNESTEKTFWDKYGDTAKIVGAIVVNHLYIKNIF